MSHKRSIFNKKKNKIKFNTTFKIYFFTKLS